MSEIERYLIARLVMQRRRRLLLLLRWRLDRTAYAGPYGVKP